MGPESPGGEGLQPVVDEASRERAQSFRDLTA